MKGLSETIIATQIPFHRKCVACPVKFVFSVNNNKNLKIVGEYIINDVGVYLITG